MIQYMVVDDSLILLKAWEYCHWAKNNIATFTSIEEALLALKTLGPQLKILVCDLTFPNTKREEVIAFLWKARELTQATIWVSSLCECDPNLFIGLESIEIVAKGPPKQEPILF